MTIEIRDPEFLNRLKATARRKGIKPADFEDFAKTQVIRAARRAVGMDDDLSPGEAAAWLNCHRNTIFAYMAQKRFPNAYYLSARRLRIPMKDLAALSVKGRVAAS